MKLFINNTRIFLSEKALIPKNNLILNFNSNNDIGSFNNDSIHSSVFNTTYIAGHITPTAAQFKYGNVAIPTPNDTCFSNLTECVSFTLSLYLKLPDLQDKNIFSISGIHFYCGSFNASLPFRKYCKIEVFTKNFQTEFCIHQT